MASRLLSALDARIATTRDPLQHSCLRAERATLLARQGHIDEARAELARLRARYATEPNAVVSAWVSLGEGLVVYFSNMGEAARDKVRRALALSEAVNATSLSALSAAWLAQMDFSCQDLEAMLCHLPMAMRAAESSQHSALSRACLVAAEAFHWAERLDLALPWYSRARQYASSEGDESTVSALMHNMAWLRVAEARRRALVGDADWLQARQAQIGADSTHRFDGMIGMAALGSLVPMLQAQVLILHERYSDALEILEANLEESMQQGLQRMGCAVHADIAWCRLKLGDLKEARRETDVALSFVDVVGTHTDDQAMTHSRLAQVSLALGDFDLARTQASRADAAWEAHALRQSKLIASLTSALVGL